MDDLEAENLIDSLLEDDDDEEEEIVNEPTPPVETNATKAYSERLKKDREKIRTEERDSLAKQLGYESFDDALKAHTDNKLLDQGIDPETVKPILQDLMKNDPDYIAAMEYKKEKQELEQKLWAENQLKDLNEKFGLNLKSVNELDENTIKLWNNGLSLDEAYAAKHYADIQKVSSKKIDPGTSHLTNPGNKGSGELTTKTLTAEELKVFKQINPYATDEQIKNYINRR